MANFFINEHLASVAGLDNVLLVHPHAQRTGGGAFRSRVLVPVFGQDKVYAKLFVPNAKRWSRLQESDLARFRAYTDLHNYTDIALKRPHVCVALLRDPVYRAVSQYHYVKETANHRHHALAERFGLEEFYRRASWRDPTYFRNVQCRRICGYGSARRAAEFIATRYIGVGFTDRLNEFLLALCPVMGWPNIAVKSRGYDEQRYEAEVSASFRATVLADNREDQQLFEFVSAGCPEIRPTGAVRELRALISEARDLGLAALWRAARL